MRSYVDHTSAYTLLRSFCERREILSQLSDLLAGAMCCISFIRWQNTGMPATSVPCEHIFYKAKKKPTQPKKSRTTNTLVIDECGVAGTVVSVSVKAEIYFYDCVIGRTDGRLRRTREHLWFSDGCGCCKAIKKKMADETL